MVRDLPDSSDRNTVSEGPRVDRIFDTDPADPYDTTATVQQFLSQKTRHNILQVIIGHPKHLVSVTEFGYYLPRARSTIREQLDTLAEHELIEKYHRQQNERVRNLPAGFWGFTAFGVRLLSEYKYLCGLPVLRAVHDATRKPETIRRHEAAPRPDLPNPIREALSYDEPDTTNPPDNTPVTESFGKSVYANAAPADPSILNESTDGDRTLDELF